MERQSWWSLILVLVVMYITIMLGEASWCTRHKSELIPHIVTEMHKCNKSYEASCSMFSWDTCTYYEIVDCPVRKNITVTRYFLVEECCPGFEIDPANNITCIPLLVPAMRDGQDSLTTIGFDRKSFGVTVSIADKDTHVMNKSESQNDVSSAPNDNQKKVVGDSDGMLFGLSHGAYAGIICSMLFFLCVLVLIMLHMRKRSKKTKAKEKTTTVEMETTQKMLSSPA